MRYTDLADPFQGNGEIALPKPSFPASSWRFIKGLSGNTTPAAALPFGKYTCCAYDAAYPTGYGINRINSGEIIEKLYDAPKCIGLSHFHVSGTGGIKYYYNYALCAPFAGDFPDFAPLDILDEAAKPGYYMVRTAAARMEATVSESVVLHRYELAAPGGIAIDFANDGLYEPRQNVRGEVTGKLRILSEHEMLAEMRLADVTWWFAVHCTGGTVGMPFRGTDIFCSDALSLDKPSRDTRFGGIFRCTGKAELRMAISARSADHALALLARETRSFEEVRQAAADRWEQFLGKIDIVTEDPTEQRIFYSNLYHTLIKPMDLSGEGFFFADPDGDFTPDLATMWDIYKTQLPLLFTLYPEISRKLLVTLQRFAEEYGRFPHCLILSGNTTMESVQARTLAEYSICDAYYRGIPADYEKLYRLSLADAARFPDYDEDACPFASHTLDMAEALVSLSGLAKALGHTEDAEKLADQNAHLRTAYDPDGLMRADSAYYEGSRWNYSFRLMHDPAARFAFAGTNGKQVMTDAALRFFGFTNPETIPPVDPVGTPPQATAFFEGFNNETDMEAPYFLHDLGQRDRMCEVLTSGMDSMFTTGRGGIPGNADSGGLTACYLWNVLGIFPVSGQDRMIVGTPRYEKTVLHLPAGDFTIRREGKGIYTEAAALNGRALGNFEFAASEMVKGGELVIFCRETPTEG